MKLSKKLNKRPYNSESFEEENLIIQGNNIVKIRNICDSLILAITDFELLIEYGDNKIKKINDLYEEEKFTQFDTENELFGIFLKRDSFESLNKIDAFNYKNQIRTTENTIDVEKLIKNLTRIFETKINLIGKKITLFNEIETCIPAKIFFDEKKLKQILFNLLTNALKFSIHGKIRIKLEYKKETKNLVFYVIDTGIGIDKDILQKIGEPYLKTNNNNNQYGIGMGIHLVMKLVRSLNGVFKIESEINQGTTIILEFPYDIEAKSKIFDESNKNFASKFNKYKNSNISSLITVKDKNNLRAKNFNNTELKTINYNNTFKSEYEFFEDFIMESNINPKYNNYRILKKSESYGEYYCKNIRTKSKSSSHKILLNVKNLLNDKNNQTNWVGDKCNFKYFSHNYLSKKIDGSFESNIENEKFNKIHEDLNNNKDSQKIKGELLNGSKDLTYKAIHNKNILEDLGLNFRENSKKYYIFSEKNSDMKEKSINLSFNSLNKSLNKKYLQPFLENSSNLINLYSIKNNISNDELNKHNISNENSIGGETVVLNESFINRNLNSLKNDKEIISMDILKIHKIENPKKPEVQYKKNSSFRRFSNMNKSMFDNKTNKSENTSFSESNLELDMEISIKNNKINSPHQTKLLRTKTDKKIILIEEILNLKESNCLDKNKNEQENKKLFFNPKIFNENSKDRRTYRSFNTSKSRIENIFNYDNCIVLKESSNLTGKNILEDGQLIIFNDNKITDNLHVIINDDNNLHIHSLNNHISGLSKSNNEYILSSKYISKIKNKIPNFDINKSCLLRKENLKTICNLIENKNNLSNINKCENVNVYRILIVDDEELIRKSQINIIKKYSIKKNILVEIEECEDGIECLFKIYKGSQIGKKYNLIITDETMNYMKGSFMAKILKKLIAEKVIYDIRIIMVTSYGSENFTNIEGNIIEKVFSKPMRMNIIDDILNFC